MADLASGTASGDAEYRQRPPVQHREPLRHASRRPARRQRRGQRPDRLLRRGCADRAGRRRPVRLRDRYDSAPKAPDRILDFSRAQGDRIDLRGVDANEQVDGDQAFQFIGQASSPAPGSSASTSRTATRVEANTTDAIAGAELRDRARPAGLAAGRRLPPVAESFSPLVLGRPGRSRRHKIAAPGTK